MKPTKDKCGQCDEYLAGWKRAQADYANLKKDLDKTRIEMAAFANEHAVARLLPALDQLETALEHAPDVANLLPAERQRLQSWLDGVCAVKALWDQSFKDMGLERVDTAGTFDPLKHEAVGQEQDAAKPPYAILRVARSGWSLNGKIIRPAAVIVNSANI